MKFVVPQNQQNGDVSKLQNIKSKINIKEFFKISKEDDKKSPLQYICAIVGVVSCFLLIFWYDDWYNGVIKTETMTAIAFLAFLTINAFIGGRATFLAILLFFVMFGFSYFLVSGKMPSDSYFKNKVLEEPPHYEHVIVFDKNSVGSPGHSKRFKYDRYLRVIVENGPVKAIFGNNVSVVLVPGQHPVTVKKGEILGFESLGESKITIVNDP